MTIFRLIQMMERRGPPLRDLRVRPVGQRARRAAASSASEILDHFIPIEAQVFNGLDYWIGADVGIATQWWTAYPMRDLPGCYEKVYLVQDFEPAFYPYSAEYIWAEETYRMGYRCVAYTPWMAEILRSDYGLESEWFECGTDLDTYTFARGGREPATVAVYARQETARRGVELALAALALLKERRPEVRVVLFGSYSPAEAGFDHARTSASWRRHGSRSSTAGAPVGRRLLAHHALARGAGDDGLGLAGGRAGGRQRRPRRSAARARWSSRPSPIRCPSPPRSRR